MTLPSRSLIYMLLANTWCCMLAVAAQTHVVPGDTVIVAKDGTHFGVRDQAMLTFAAGTKLHVTEVRGDWVGGYVIFGGQKLLGWVRHMEVLAANAQATPATPQTPPAVVQAQAKSNAETRIDDDKVAVAALTALGVKLNADDTGRVRQLDAEGAKLRDENLVHLRGLPNLLTLDLVGQPITDQGLVHVAACKNLKILYLGKTGITDDGLPRLVGLKRLEVLSVPETSITGAGLKHIAALEQLHALNMRECRVTDDDLRNIVGLGEIRTLALAKTQVTDAGLVHVKSLAKLISLNLDGTKITGVGFDNLVGLSELRMLYVRDCSVEADRINKLDGELPGLAIYD